MHPTSHKSGRYLHSEERLREIRQNVQPRPASKQVAAGL